VFFGEDPRRQRLDRISVEHRDRRLKNDRTAVGFRRDDMDRRAGDAHSVVKRLPLRVKPGKPGQERRVHVQHQAGKRLEQRSAAVAEHVDDRAFVGVAVGIVTRTEAHRLDARVVCALEPRGLAAVRDHDRNCRFEAARGDRVDDRLKVAAAPRDQHGKTAAAFHE
jgi:hypothetical protein